MGVLVQGLHSEVDRSRSCSKEAPFGTLLSSLLSAKDIIIPVVTFSAFGRIPTEHNPNVRMADSFLATVNAREENAICCYSSKEKSPEFPCVDVKGIPFVNCFFQGPSNFGKADLHKESQHWQTSNGYGDLRKDLCDVSPSSSPQNQLLAAFLEGLSNSCLNPFPKHGNARTHCFSKVSSSDRDQKELPLPAGLQKHFYGLSLQGLPHFVVTPCSVFKPDCMDGKDSNSMCFVNTEDSYDLQKPSMTSIFQAIMDHCLLASSNLSKHAVQLLPWNDSLICNSSDSKEDLGGPCTENNCLDKTLQDFQVSSSSHKQDLDNKRKEQKCLRSEPLGFARVGGDPRKPHEQEENLKTTTGLFGVQIPNIERLRSTLATVSLTELMEHIPQIGIARIGGEPSKPHEEEENLKTTTGLFGVQIPNIDRLRSRLATVSLMELMEHIPQIGKTSQDFPDKKKLFSVQDFFRYTEAEGRRFFEELDRDSDGQVTLEDLEVAMRKRRLPQQYAREFLRRTRKHWFAKSFGWSEFLSLMEQKEPMMLRAFNLLSLSKSGTLQKGQVLSSLRNAGLPASEENAAAMMRYLDADTEGSIAYGQFRNFMLLLPPERLVDDPRMVWFEAATLMPMTPPVAMPAESVLKSALAGGLACALSTSLMHPIDTMKTRVQASSTLSFRELISKLPEIGVRGLYRGSVPAILGQFSSHGLRTGIFEASKLLLTSLAPDVPELQVQSLASLCSTVLGTAVRIPCEVLKQRLQAGIFDSVGDAIIGTWQQDGPKGFFRGTGATLCREVPFYVAGMGIYAELKKVMHHVLNRELAPWETITVGAMSGGLAAVFTTPFDVMKTRTMTAAPGMPTRMSAIAISIVREEGFLGLFKGAVPRFFWIAPLGAMNFAGYELAKRAMENNKH